MVAFLFAQPKSQALTALDADGEYFDHRTGDIWDLFFPGYYRSADPRLEPQTGAQPVGREHARDWFFSAREFNVLRAHVQEASRGQWTYSGGVDLVLVNAWLPATGDPVLDWASVISRTLSDQRGQTTTSVAHVIESITSDLETGAEDAAYGVAEAPTSPSGRSVPRDVTVGALGGIVAALVKSGIGL